MAAKIILFGLRLIIGGLFIYAGAMKAGSTQEFARDIQHFALIPWPDATVLLAIYLPWLEIASGFAVISRPLVLGGLVAIVGMTMLFAVALSSAWARGLDIECGCFGREKMSVRTHFPALLARDFAMLAGAGVLLAAEWSAARRLRSVPPLQDEFRDRHA